MLCQLSYRRALRFLPWLDLARADALTLFSDVKEAGSVPSSSSDWRVHGCLCSIYPIRRVRGHLRWGKRFCRGNRQETIALKRPSDFGHRFCSPYTEDGPTV